MDELYVFGYGFNKQFPKSLRTGFGQRPEHLLVKTLSTPICTLRAKSIDILWTSWCDLILKVDDTTFHYYGTSLTQPQIDAIENLPTDLTHQPTFFGRRDTSGVLGFILPPKHFITIFHGPEETALGASPVSTYSYQNAPWAILDIQFTASESVLVSLKPQAAEPSTLGSVIEMPGLSYLEKEVLDRRLTTLFHTSEDKTTLTPGFQQRAQFAPMQCCTNSATLTALDVNGKVHTYATDRRFPSAAGRDPRLMDEYEGGHQDVLRPILFLEETSVKKVAAGGLYTAAVSDDGELYIWGQATTDMLGELCAIRDKEEAGDEYVRTPEWRIDGQVARVTDVAVGFGHVLVAVERQGGDGTVKRAVFAAGNNRHGSLGLGPDMVETGFVEDFKLVETLNGKRIKQMGCAGMSSYVVVEGETYSIRTKV